MNIILEPALHWSGYLRRYLNAHPEAQNGLVVDVAQALTRKTILQWYDELKPGAKLQRANVQANLRALRSRVFNCLLVRDIAGMATLHEVVAAMSLLADLAVSQAYACATHELAHTYGRALNPVSGKAQDMLILGMGKLGGKELNVSSDIDLVMVYAQDGTTDGPKSISNHEYYVRVCRILNSILSEPTANGIVFRTDLRLRPDGANGPLAWSMAALGNYLIKQGREWERYAWLKARVIHCPVHDPQDFSQQTQQLEALRQPFVYRKYLDFDSLAALRGLRERIRSDWQQRAQGRRGVESQHNIKLGEGGIREIEFVVQLNQLIRAGRRPSLQQRNLIAALHKQRRAGIISTTMAGELEAAYRFLRKVEHRLQYREDEQTHLLPRAQDTLALLASTMGCTDAQAFMTLLEEHRDNVKRYFQDAFRVAGIAARQAGSSKAPTKHHTTQPIPAPTEAPVAADPANAAEIASRIKNLLESHRMQKLPLASRERLAVLMPLIRQAALATENPLLSLQRMLNLIEHIAQRSSYLALLAEYTDTLQRIARIVNASTWASEYLMRHPMLLDSLIEWHSLMQAPDFQSIAEQLAGELDACLLADGHPDVEQQMNLMRDVHHQTTFKLLAQDLEGLLNVETLADYLSALADLLLAEAINRVWPQVGPKHTAALQTPSFAVIAYGKLGGKELGYASDLDLVFLYDESGPYASELYAKLGRRVCSWLSTLTSSGRLYEIDLRLRPDGDAGLLAVTVDAFERYQFKQAWPWEHQAITRARFVAGDTRIGARFEDIRKRILLLPRDISKLRADVILMRNKIAQGHPNRSGLFDLKHDPGGMVDIEFITQFLVLGHARTYTGLLANLGNIALLGLAAQAGLIDSELASQAADSYRMYRRRQHALRLQGADKARVDPDEFTQQRASVKALWEHVLEN